MSVTSTSCPSSNLPIPLEIYIATIGTIFLSLTSEILPWNKDHYDFNTKYPSDWLQIRQSKLTGFIDRKPVLHELNARLTKNVMALPKTVGFKAEAVNEEGV